MSSGKRQATSELNHDNWNKEEEPEDRGTFRTAPPEELKNRVIKKARRKGIAETASASPPNTGVFSGFGGFGKPASQSAATPFSFLSKLTNNTPVKVNTDIGANVTTQSPFITSFTPSNPPSTTPSITASTTPTVTPIMTPSITVTSAEDEPATENVKTAKNGPSSKKKKLIDGESKSHEYFLKIKELNKSVATWIKSHVDKNPLCILSPVFDDYEKQLKDIQNNEEAKKTKQTDSVKTSTLKVDTKPFFSFTSATSPINKGSNVNDTFSADTSNKSEEKPKTNGFSFGSEKPTIHFALETDGESSPNETNFKDDDKPTTSAAAAAALSIGGKKQDKSRILFGINTRPKSAIKSTPKKEAKPVFTFGFKNTYDKSDSSTPFSFLNKNDEKPSTSTAVAAPFSFGSKTSTDGAPKTGFFFGTGDKSSGTGFSFKPTNTTFPFGNIANVMPPSTTSATGTENTEDEPPKVEFKQVVEEDAIYSKKCKIFVKKDAKFAERGVGTLYLKPVNETGKTQLLVRADTNLGNILVNIILTKAIPAQRMGSNNVILVCIPTAEFEKPTSVLIRVKNDKEADELFETIEKYRI